MGRCLPILGLVVGLAWGCGPATFGCDDDSQCADGARAGTCELSGYCSFPDGGCESGHRYGEFAAGDLAGACVPFDEPAAGSTSGEVGTSDGASASASSGTTTGASSSTSSAGPTSTTEPVDDSTTTDSGDETTGVGSTGAVSDDLDFVDEFDRSDSADIGNDWVEKNPSAFQIVGQSVVFETSSSGGYPNNVVYRPFPESMLDVEVTAELRFSDVGPPGHPQVHARVQEADIGPSGSVTCYLLYIEDGGILQITRQEAGTFARRESVSIASPPNTSDLYRLRLRVTGTDPVRLDGYLERDAGGAWVEEAHIGFEDDETTRIVDPGTFGFSGHLELDHYDYLRFTADGI